MKRPKDDEIRHRIRMESATARYAMATGRLNDMLIHQGMATMCQWFLGEIRTEDIPSVDPALMEQYASEAEAKQRSERN